MSGGSVLCLEAQSMFLSSRQLRPPISNQSHGGVLSAGQRRWLQRDAASTLAGVFPSPYRGLSSVEQVSGGHPCPLQPEAPGWEKIRVMWCSKTLVMKPETVLAQGTGKIEPEVAFIFVCWEQTLPWDAVSQGDRNQKIWVASLNYCKHAGEDCCLFAFQSTLQIHWKTTELAQSHGFGGVPQSGQLLTCHSDISSHSRPLCFSTYTVGTVVVMTFHLVRLQGTLELPASSTASSNRAALGINEPYLGTSELHKLKNWNPILL